MRREEKHLHQLYVCSMLYLTVITMWELSPISPHFKQIFFFFSSKWAEMGLLGRCEGEKKVNYTGFPKNIWDVCGNNGSKVLILC